MSFTLSISGSSGRESSNTRLLKAIKNQYYADFHLYNIQSLPLFQPDLDSDPDTVLEWRSAVKDSDGLLISTPAYLYNMPATLKNALEWLTTSGELYHKKVLPVTYTPHPPRGEKAMQSLLWTLQALNANIVAQLDLYQTELKIDRDLNLRGADSIEILDAAIELLIKN